jgi:vancomycin resistance protein VanW
VVPWGVGCTIVHNYVDLVLRNDSTTTFQLRVRVTDQHLLGELRADRSARTTYAVEARAERFVWRDGAVHRENELWRRRTDLRTGRVTDELLRRNRARVLYEVDPALVEARQEADATTRPRSTTQAGRSRTERSSSGLAS